MAGTHELTLQFNLAKRVREMEFRIVFPTPGCRDRPMPKCGIQPVDRRLVPSEKRAGAIMS